MQVQATRLEAVGAEVDISDWTELTEFTTLTEKEMATGIESLTANEKSDANEVYDLQGRRVARHPAKGIYVVNGKKIVVK